MRPEDVAVLVTTYLPPGQEEERLKALEAALSSWVYHLRAPAGGRFRLLIADDHSSSRAQTLLAALAYRCLDRDRTNWAAVPMMLPASRPGGVGASLNRGIEEIRRLGGEYIFYAVDDWALTERLDLGPVTGLLAVDETVGAVRFGPFHPDLAARVKHTPHGWTLRFDRAAGGYVFGTRPTLFHRRFFDAYGRFDEGCSALAAEDGYNQRFCTTPMPPPHPDILGWLPSPFSPVPSVELSAFDPHDRPDWQSAAVPA